MEAAKAETQKASDRIDQLVHDTVDQTLLAFAYEKAEGLPDRKKMIFDLKENVHALIAVLMQEEKERFRRIFSGPMGGYATITDQFAYDVVQRSHELFFPIEDVKPAVHGAVKQE